MVRRGPQEKRVAQALHFIESTIRIDRAQAAYTVGRIAKDQDRPDRSVHLSSRAAHRHPEADPAHAQRLCVQPKDRGGGVRRDQGLVLLLGLPIAHNLPLACPGIQGYFLHGGKVVFPDDEARSDVFPDLRNTG